MNNWSAEEIEFRCQRLSIRLERLAQNFEQMALLSQELSNGESVLALLRLNKSFLELAALDLDVDNAFELAQMQRQLSRWHLKWEVTWGAEANRVALTELTHSWATQIRKMAGVLV